MLIDFSLFVFSHPSNKRPGRLLKGAPINSFSNLGGRLLEGAFICGRALITGNTVS